MKQFKGTPGPWREYREGFSTVYIESKLRDGVIQEVAACGPAEAGSEQQSANANLIAAAPELLEALQNCAYWLEVHSEPFSIEHDHAQSAKAAINKALVGE